MGGLIPAFGNPDAKLWLGVGAATASAVVLGAYTIMLALTTSLADGCGEDLRWLALVLATAVASVAAMAGWAVGGWSLVRGAVLRRRAVWSAAIVVGALVAWSGALVSVGWPNGACPGV